MHYHHFTPDANAPRIKLNFNEMCTEDGCTFTLGDIGKIFYEEKISTKHQLHTELEFKNEDCPLCYPAVQE